MDNISVKKGNLSLVFCSLLWSTGGLFIKLIDWHPMVICGIRGAIAAAVIYLVLTKLGYKGLAIDKRCLFSAFFLGITCTLFVISNKMTTAANAIMLQSANPIFVIAFGAIFKKEKTSRRDIITAALVLFGVALFFFEQLSFSGLVGNMVALLSAVTIASAFMFTCEAKNLHESISGVVLGHAFSAVLSLPFFFIYPPSFSIQSVGAILFLGVFQLGIAYALFAVGASVCTPLAVSLLGMLEPVFNPIWVAIFLHEIPGTTALIGSVIVMATLTCWCILNSKTEKA